MVLGIPGLSLLFSKNKKNLTAAGVVTERQNDIAEANTSVTEILEEKKRLLEAKLTTYQTKAQEADTLVKQDISFTSQLLSKLESFKDKSIIQIVQLLIALLTIFKTATGEENAFIFEIEDENNKQQALERIDDPQAKKRIADMLVVKDRVYNLVKGKEEDLSDEKKLFEIREQYEAACSELLEQHTAIQELLTNNTFITPEAFQEEVKEDFSLSDERVKTITSKQFSNEQAEAARQEIEQYDQYKSKIILDYQAVYNQIMGDISTKKEELARQIAHINEQIGALEEQEKRIKNEQEAVEKHSALTTKIDAHKEQVANSRKEITGVTSFISQSGEQFIQGDRDSEAYYEEVLCLEKSIGEQIKKIASFTRSNNLLGKKSNQIKSFTAEELMSPEIDAYYKRLEKEKEDINNELLVTAKKLTVAIEKIWEYFQYIESEEYLRTQHTLLFAQVPEEQKNHLTTELVIAKKAKQTQTQRKENIYSHIPYLCNYKNVWKGHISIDLYTSNTSGYRYNRRILQYDKCSFRLIKQSLCIENLSTIETQVETYLGKNREEIAELKSLIKERIEQWCRNRNKEVEFTPHTLNTIYGLYGDESIKVSCTFCLDPQTGIPYVSLIITVTPLTHFYKNDNAYLIRDISNTKTYEEIITIPSEQLIEKLEKREIFDKVTDKLTMPAK